ncbi:MAG: hypothetical protein KBT12_03115, partial [Bacteroidales bacterium]|nr:hypothetical protein [Candidatus Physcousia equi]
MAALCDGTVERVTPEEYSWMQVVGCLFCPYVYIIGIVKRESLSVSFGVAEALWSFPEHQI